MKKLFARLLISIGLLQVLTGQTGCAPPSREEIVISIPYSEYVRNVDTNYYKLWLEAQTGLSIRFDIIQDKYSVDYLESAVASGHVQSDAFFSIFGKAESDGYNSIVQEFGEKGYILPLNQYIEQSEYLNAIFEAFTDYDLRAAMTSPDGNIYYMPGLDPSASRDNFQVLWLNQSWLKRLKLDIPNTTGELKAVLSAFKDGDPNGDGKLTEIPLAGSFDTPAEQSCNFLISAFVYNDPANSRLFVEDGAVRFAPVTNEWRAAMQYLNGLYKDGLISPLQFTLGHTGLESLANDPARMLGGFTSASINDVIFQSNPDIVHDYVHVAPLTGPSGVRSATVRTPLPKPFGVITSSCDNPEAVFKLFDLMLSEQAFLIGRYGEENVDWVRANVTDMDFYGNSATVRVVNQLSNRIQNKHLCELGPYYAYPEYADGVAFVAADTDQEYVNARAYRVYSRYASKDHIDSMIFDTGPMIELRNAREAIDAYTEEHIKAFTTGEADPFDDAAWDRYLLGFKNLGVDSFVAAAQEAYDKENAQITYMEFFK